MRPARTVGSGLLIAALAGCVLVQSSSAEAVHKARRTTPAHQAHATPDATATINKPTVSAAPQAPSARDVEIPPPFLLPTASRARVRACGETWRDMKMAGTTGDTDWRDFAVGCLAGKGAAGAR